MSSLNASKRKGIVAFWRAVPRSLNALLAASIILLLVKVLYFNKQVEFFAGAYQLGVIFEGALASVIASYIFYLFIVHKKEMDDELAIRPFVLRQAKMITGRCGAMLNEFASASQNELNFERVTEDELRLALEKINPNEQAPLIVGPGLAHAKWYQYPMDNIFVTKRCIEKIYTQAKFLRADLISLLGEIEDSNYIHFVTTVNRSGETIRNTDMSVFSGPIFKHVILCRRLDALIDGGR